MNDLKYVDKICKIGQGKHCCRYLVAGAKGLECAKKTYLKRILDLRAENNFMSSAGDNCEGFEIEESRKILNKPMFKDMDLDNNLERPLIFFDLETTGADPQKDRIVQFSFIHLTPDGEYKKWNDLINPEKPIMAGATKIHGITNEDVKNKHTFGYYAKRLYEGFKDADLAGYNILRFDIPILINEFKRAGIDFSITGRRIIDIYLLYAAYNPRDLKSAYKHYTDKDLSDAHDAAADTEAAYEIFLQMQKDHPNPPPGADEGFSIGDLDSVHEFCMGERADVMGKLAYNENKELCFNFGKNRGVRVVDEKEYASWMLGADFADDTKALIKSVLTT